MTARLLRNDQAGRYELWQDERLGSILEFRDTGSVPALTHAETSRELRGHGLAAQVTDFALADARAAGLKVDPICWFVSEHIDHHRDQYADLLVDDPHAAFCEIERRLE